MTRLHCCFIRRFMCATTRVYFLQQVLRCSSALRVYIYIYAHNNRINSSLRPRTQYERIAAHVTRSCVRVCMCVCVVARHLTWKHVRACICLYLFLVVGQAIVLFTDNFGDQFIKSSLQRNTCSLCDSRPPYKFIGKREISFIQFFASSCDQTELDFIFAKASVNIFHLLFKQSVTFLILTKEQTVLVSCFYIEKKKKYPIIVYYLCISDC